MFKLLNQFAHKAELRESKDEIMVGEIVRAMSRQGWPTIEFIAHDDRQSVRFLTRDDETLHSVYVVLDRKTGTGAVSGALFGSKATLKISAEVRNRLSDPDDLVNMFKTDLANILKLPVIGGIKLNHELNSIYATQTKIIEIDNYVGKGDKGVESLARLLRNAVNELRVKLKPYKK